MIQPAFTYRSCKMYDGHADGSREEFVFPFRVEPEQLRRIAAATGIDRDPVLVRHLQQHADEGFTIGVENNRAVKANIVHFRGSQTISLQRNLRTGAITERAYIAKPGARAALPAQWLAAVAAVLPPGWRMHPIKKIVKGEVVGVFFSNDPQLGTVEAASIQLQRLAALVGAPEEPLLHFIDRCRGMELQGIALSQMGKKPAVVVYAVGHREENLACSALHPFIFVFFRQR